MTSLSYAKQHRLAIMILSCAMVAGCGSTQIAGVGEPALGIRIVDSLSGATVASGATLVAQSGTMADTIHVGTSSSNNANEVLIGDRTGVYSVAISKPGYRVWTQSNVSVSGASQFEATTVHLVAKLQPSP